MMTKAAHKGISIFQLTLVLLLVQLLMNCSAGENSSPDGSVMATDGAQEGFIGVTEVKPNGDGTWTIGWASVVGAQGVTYNVFQRKADETFDFTNVTFSTKNNFYVSDDLRLQGDTCFNVRFVQLNSAVSDENTQEICTKHAPYVFKGVEKIISLRSGEYLLEWARPDFKGARFRIFSQVVSSDEELQAIKGTPVAAGGRLEEGQVQDKKRQPGVPSGFPNRIFSRQNPSHSIKSHVLSFVRRSLVFPWIAMRWCSVPPKKAA